MFFYFFPLPRPAVGRAVAGPGHCMRRRSDGPISRDATVAVLVLISCFLLLALWLAHVVPEMAHAAAAARNVQVTKSRIEAKRKKHLGPVVKLAPSAAVRGGGRRRDQPAQEARRSRATADQDVRRSGRTPGSQEARKRPAVLRHHAPN